MSKIPFGLSNVAETVISEINADATLSAGGSGNKMTFAGITFAQSGTPFKAHAVNKSNLNAIFGKPYHSSKGLLADSMRSLAEAVSGGSGVVVRVVPATATYPVLTVKAPAKKTGVKAKEGGEPAPAPTQTVEVTAKPYNALPEAVDGDSLIIYTVDGNPDPARHLTITKANIDSYGDGFYEVVLSRVDALNNAIVLERHIVSLDAEATDDMGSPAFIETVLESKSNRLRAISIAESIEDVAATALTGATNGDLADITTEDMLKAISVLDTSLVRFNAVCGLSVYDADAIKALIDICNSRRIGGFFDINPRLTHAEALQAMTDLSVSEHRASFTHFPYSSIDSTYKNRVVFGLSGVQFSAKAAGVAKTAPTGGWHYTAAGEERGLISRFAVQQLENIGTPDFDAMYTKRLNKIGVNGAGLLFIDDSLTSFTKENYLRFEQQVSVADAMSRDVLDLTNRLKHEPDGVTRDGLTKGMIDIAEQYVSTKALVPPRDPADGKEPYKIVIEQVELDLWRIAYSISVTGSARRFLCEPILIK